MLSQPSTNPTAVAMWSANLVVKSELYDGAIHRLPLSFHQPLSSLACDWQWVSQSEVCLAVSTGFLTEKGWRNPQVHGDCSASPFYVEPVLRHRIHLEPFKKSSWDEEEKKQTPTNTTTYQVPVRASNGRRFEAQRSLNWCELSLGLSNAFTVNQRTCGLKKERNKPGADLFSPQSFLQQPPGITILNESSSEWYMHATANQTINRLGSALSEEETVLLKWALDITSSWLNSSHALARSPMSLK